MHDRVTICGGVLGGHPRLVADEILALSVANCRSTWRWRDGSRAKIEPHRKAPWDKAGGAIGKVGKCSTTTTVVRTTVRRDN